MCILCHQIIWDTKIKCCASLGCRRLIGDTLDILDQVYSLLGLLNKETKGASGTRILKISTENPGTGSVSRCDKNKLKSILSFCFFNWEAKKSVMVGTVHKIIFLESTGFESYLLLNFTNFQICCNRCIKHFCVCDNLGDTGS